MGRGFTPCQRPFSSLEKGHLKSVFCGHSLSFLTPAGGEPAREAWSMNGAAVREGRRLEIRVYRAFNTTNVYADGADIV